MAEQVPGAATRVEVFADITCPFTHVGLKRVVELMADTAQPVDVVVRAWPLEWVNGSVMEVAAVQVKAEALCRQLDVADFDGLRADRWPTTTIPALNLAAEAYERDTATGLAVSLAIRVALFEQGLDVSDPAVLTAIAVEHGLAGPDNAGPDNAGPDNAGQDNAGPDNANQATDAAPAVRADYEDGRARGVSGSPHFWVDQNDFFCPSLDLGHDDDGNLTAQFDAAGLEQFLVHLGL